WSARSIGGRLRSVLQQWVLALKSRFEYMGYKATHRFARISARKVRPLADLVRGKYADEALELLRYMPHRGARMLEKVIKSALGNAEDRRATSVNDLVVTDC